MKSTATEGGITIEDGMYAATLLRIEDAPANKGHEDWGPQWKWFFHVYDNDEGQEMMAWSSAKLGTKTKARQWIEQILGRKLTPGEPVDSEEFCPIECQVLVKNNPETGFARIEDVLGARKHPSPKAPKTSGVTV